jgi:glycosyltransferase involved in cell wall biosynthesis
MWQAWQGFDCMNGTAHSNSPLVSVGLPVYNGERYVGDAISSVLAQSYQNFELVIADNASTDRTEQICRKFAELDGRIRYVRNAQNIGAGPNHNLVFTLSMGRYFKWCAADDRINPEFLSRCVALLEERADVVLAYPSVRSIDEDGNEIPLFGPPMLDYDHDAGPVERFRGDLKSRFWCTNWETFGLFRSEVLRQTTLHRSYYGSDQTLILELTLLGKFYRVPEAILYSREHTGRSIHIRDRDALLKWQDPISKKKPQSLYWSRFKHVIEIAFRQRKSAPPLQILAVFFLWGSKKITGRILKT